MSRVTLFLAFLLAGPTRAGLAASLPGPNVQQLIERSASEIAADWREAPNYSFIERDVERERDSQPSRKTYEVIMLDGSPYNRLISTDDQPLTPWDQAEAKHKLQSEIRKRKRESSEQRSTRISKYLKARHQDVALLQAMADAFAFQMVGSEIVESHDCWVLDASPKPGYQPTSRETKVLSGMRGRLWIDKASGQWVKVQAEVLAQTLAQLNVR